MKYIRKDIVIGYKDRFVGGFSIKTGKVYTVKEQCWAKKFTSVDAGEFLLDHISEEKEFEAQFIKIIWLDWREKFKS